MFVPLTMLTVISGPAQTSPCSTSFTAIHQQHVEAIVGRDLEAYKATLGDYDGKMMILPDGSVWDSTNDVIEGHIEWFADTSWTFDHELVHTQESDGYGLAVHEVRVNRPEKPGKPFLLTMVFAPDDGGCWKLVHDQNTPLPEG